MKVCPRIRSRQRLSVKLISEPHGRTLLSQQVFWIHRNRLSRRAGDARHNGPFAAWFRVTCRQAHDTRLCHEPPCWRQRSRRRCWLASRLGSALSSAASVVPRLGDNNGRSVKALTLAEWLGGSREHTHYAHTKKTISKFLSIGIIIIIIGVALNRIFNSY